MKKLIMVLALVCAFSLISIASAQFTPSQTWGSFGDNNGQFYGMSGITTDTSGYIYVAELDNRVQKFTGNGDYVTQFNIPARSIAIDPSGNIYATVNDSIEKFDSTGTLLNTWGSTGTGNGEFNFPTGIALDSSGNIYVSDMENNRIQKLDSLGNYNTSWGTLGSGNGSFKAPAGITVNGNYVYVADMGNYRIQKFDLNGNYVERLGSKGNGDTQFNSSIAVSKNDSSGNIYVADYYNGRVLEYDNNFNYSTQFTGLSYPTALVIANDKLYVLDSGNYRVIVYNNTSKVSPAINWSNPADITYGTALSSTQLNAVATDPETGNSVPGSFVYTPVEGIVLSAGTHTLHVDFTPADTANYTNTSKDVIINVTDGNDTPLVPIITWHNPADIKHGTALNSTQLNAVATDPDTGNSVPGTFVYTPAAGTLLGVGTHILYVDFTPADAVNYTSVSKDVTINIRPIELVTSGLAVYYDGNLSGNSLLDLSGNSNTGYATSVTSGTNQSTGASYIKFNGVNGKVNISNSAQTNISSPITVEFIGSIDTFSKYGAFASKYNALSGWYLSCSSNAPYNTARFSAVMRNSTQYGYNSNIGLVAGKVYHITATYDNSVCHIYVNNADSADPRTWNSQIAGNTYNTTIGSGYFLNYSNSSMYSFRLYNRSLSSNEVQQNYLYDLWRHTPRKPSTITWNDPADISYGTALSKNIQLNAAATDPETGNSVPGSFVYSPASGTILGAGTHTLRTTFTPYDTTNYTTASRNVSLTISKSTPLITWSDPADISGIPLSETQLNALATDPETGNSISGSFIYTPVAGTLLAEGTHILHVDFTPIDAANYTNASKNVTINVTSGPVIDGLVVYYDGNLSGNLLADLSKNNNNGYARSVTQGTRPTTGASYINLNGVNSKIDVSNNAQTNISGPMSVEFIGSINTFRRYGALVSKYSNGPLGWYLSSSSVYPYNSARFSVVMENGQKGYNSNISLDAGKVYHITATYNNSSFTHIYVNGVDSTGAPAWNSPIAGNTNNITIGSGYGLNYTNGSMYTFRLYNRSLSPDEVLHNYLYDRWRYAGKVLPVIIWNNPTNIIYGSALSSTQLNAVATDPETGNSVPGSFVYTPAEGTVLSAGTHTLHVDFTPDNAANYTNASKDVTIKVTSGPITDGLVVYYDGNVSGNSLLDLSGNSNTGYARSVTSGTNQSTGAGYISLNGANSRINVSNNAQTNVSGSMSVEFIGSINTFRRYGALVSKYSSGPLGWYLSCSPIDPYNTARFSAVLESGQKGYNSNISLVAGQVYDIVATYDNNTTHIYVNGVDSADPRIWNSPTAGSNLNITIGSGYGLNYTNCSMYSFRLYNRALSQEEVLQNYNNDCWRYAPREIPTITWNNPVNITYGIVLGSTQLNAVATDPKTGNSVPGNFVYDPVAGTLLDVGTHTLHVDFTPADTANYANTSKDVIINVSETGKITPTITWSNPANITYGTALNSTQLNANASVTGAFVYTPASGTILGAGTHTLQTTFTPTDITNYTIASSNVSLTVNKATSLITWSNPANITYGTALSSIQLNANASVPGNYNYTPAAGTLLGVGIQTLHVDFTPADAANYTNASRDVTINVEKKNELQLWTFDSSKVNAVPDNVYTASKDIPYTSNISLTYNSTLGSVDSKCWRNDNGETYFTGAYPTVNENLTFTMGVDSNSPWSFGYMHTSVADVGIRHASDGSYWIYSYWKADNGTQLNSNFQIPAASVVNNRVTVSICSYDSNRTNVIRSGPTLKVTTPYTTETTRKLPYTNVIQPLIYVDCYASGTGGWVNVHLYNITQSIPRDIITPYARNDIMGFGFDYPNVPNNKNGTDFLISRGQNASVYLSDANMENSTDIAYDQSLFANGFEECIHFYPGLASVSLEEAKATIDSQIASAEATFGMTPASWSCHGNQDNVTHAIYAYNKYGSLYRNGPMGMAFITNVDTLSNATWAWWSVSSARGAVSPCFTHRTDEYPAISYSIDPDLFRNFVTNLNSNGINLVHFSKWYYSSMAQNSTTDILQYDADYIEFQLNTSAGYPVNMNMQTEISPSYLYCNGVSIPFNQTSDGIQFMSVGNGTYTLTKYALMPSVDFTANKTEGIVPLTVKFTDTSTNNPTSWEWNFRDGNTSTERNPEHTFSSEGIYNVTLVATNASNSSVLSPTDIKSKNITVKGLPAPPVANFTANKTEGTAPLTVKFTDTSTNSPIRWEWSFGDGATSTDPNPIHVYATARTYVVNLTVSNEGGTDTESKTINVTGPVMGSPKASFTAVPQMGSVPLTVKFTDKSVNATSITWDFGDKSGISTELNPSHIYRTTGFYTVKLTATNGNKSSVASKMIIAGS